MNRLTLAEAGRILTEDYEPLRAAMEADATSFVRALKADLNRTYYPDNNNTEVPPTMNEYFHPHTIYMTAGQTRRAMDGDMDVEEALELLTQGLVPVPAFNTGDIVEFQDHRRNRYEVVDRMGNEILVRRLTPNNAGPAGEVHVVKVEDYRRSVLAGKAVVNPTDDEDEA